MLSIYLVFYNQSLKFDFLGPGLLTRSILETGVSNIVAVEKDSRFLPILMVRFLRIIKNLIDLEQIDD